MDIVDAFRRAGATAVAADANPLAPALYHAEQHDVRLIVPLTDLDQVTLARSRDELGSVVLLPDAEIVERLEDKYLAHLLFE